MKNKKLLYVLIPGTLLVWGMILHKVFTTMDGGDAGQFQNTQFVASVSTEIVNDTFSINPDYRDPFSEKVVKKIVTVAHTTAPKPTVPKVLTPWPAIVYGGIIKNQKSNKQLALIQINGQSNMMKTGEEVNGIQLTKVFRDSIEVEFQKEKKHIRK